MDGQGYIETVPKLGYRFLPEVHEIPDGNGELVFSRRTRTRIVLHEEVDEEETEDGPAPLRHMKVGAKPKPARTALALNLAAGAALLIAFTITAAGFFLYTRTIHTSEASQPLQALKFVRLTTSGEAENAAISSDGKYVSFAWSRDGRQLAMTRGRISGDVVLISNFH